MPDFEKKDEITEFTGRVSEKNHLGTLEIKKKMKSPGPPKEPSRRIHLETLEI